MSKQSKTQKMSAGDVLSGGCAPGVSSVTGQHLQLNGKTAIDPAAKAQVVEAGQTIRIPSGTTLCIFGRGFEQVETIKIHATEELTMTGPMMWAEMPTADVEKILEERSKRGVPNLRDIGYFEFASMIAVTAMICHILSAPVKLLNDMLQDSVNDLSFWILWMLLSLFFGGIIFSLGFKIVARLVELQGEYITMSFSRYLMVTPPNIDALIEDQSAA